MAKARSNGEVWAAKPELDALWAQSCAEIEVVLDTQKERHNKSNAQDRDIRQDIDRVRGDLREDLPRMWASTPHETWEDIEKKFGKKLARLKNLGGIRAIQTTIERQGQVFRTEFERLFRLHMATHTNGDGTNAATLHDSETLSDGAEDGTHEIAEIEELLNDFDVELAKEESAVDAFSDVKPNVDLRTLPLFADRSCEDREAVLREGMHNLLRKIFAGVLDSISLSRKECFSKTEVQSLHRFYRAVLDAVTKGVYDVTRSDVVLMADLRASIDAQLALVHPEKIIKPHELAKEWDFADIASECREYWLNFLQIELKEDNPQAFERLLSATVENIPEFKLDDIRAKIMPKKSTMKGSYSWADQELWWLKNENPSGQPKNSDVRKRYANELNALFHGGLEVREYNAVKKEGTDLMRSWVDTRKPKAAPAAQAPVPAPALVAPSPSLTERPADPSLSASPEITMPLSPVVKSVPAALPERAPSVLPLTQKEVVTPPLVIKNVADAIQKVVSSPVPHVDVQGDFGHRGPEWFRGLKNVLNTLHRGMIASLSKGPGKLRVDAMLDFLRKEEVKLVSAVESLQRVWFGKGSEMLQLMTFALQEWHVLESYYIGLTEEDDNIDASRMREGIDIVVDNVYGGHPDDVPGGVGQIYNLAHNHEQAHFVAGEPWTVDDYVYQRLTFRYAPDQLTPRSSLSKKEYEDLRRWMQKGCKDGYITPKKRDLYREWFTQGLSDGTRDVTNEAFDAAIQTILVELARRTPSNKSYSSEEVPLPKKPLPKSPSPIADPQVPAVQVPEPDPAVPSIADLTPSPVVPAETGDVFPTASDAEVHVAEQQLDIAAPLLASPDFERPLSDVAAEEESILKENDTLTDMSVLSLVEPQMQSLAPDVVAVPERSPMEWAERIRNGALQSVQRLQSELVQALTLAASWDGSMLEHEEAFDDLRMRVEECDQELEFARIFAIKICNDLLPDMSDDEKRQELLKIEERLKQHDALTAEIATFSDKWRGVVESIKRTGQQFTAAKRDLRLLRSRDVFGVSLADILGSEHVARLEMSDGDEFETAMMEMDQRIAGLAQDFVMTTEVHAHVCKDKEDRISYDVTDIREKVAEARRKLPNIIVPPKKEGNFDPPLRSREECLDDGHSKTDALPKSVTVNVTVGGKKEQLILNGMQQRLVSFLAYNWANERDRNKSRGETTEDLREYWQRAYPDEEAPRSPDVHAALESLSYDFADGASQRAIPKLDKRKTLEASRDSGNKLFLRVAVQATKVMRYVYVPNDRAFGVNAQLPSQARELATHIVTNAKKEQSERIAGRLNAYKAVMIWADTADLSDAAAGFVKMREILGQFLQGQELDRSVQKYTRELPKMLEIYRQKRAEKNAAGVEASEEDAD